MLGQQRVPMATPQHQRQHTPDRLAASNPRPAALPTCLPACLSVCLCLQGASAVAAAKTIHITAADVQAVSMAWAEPYASWHQNSKYLQRDQGEHYKLLSHIATQFKNSVLVDMGTNLGYSALALATRAAELNNSVRSYDIMNNMPKDHLCVRDVPGVTLLLRDAALDVPEIARTAQVVLLDVDPHDGKQERVIIAELIKHGFRGLMIMDDINLSKDMLDLWNWVTLEKLEVTQYGHASGTGIVFFDKKTINAEIIDVTKLRSTVSNVWI
jgi:predicted O-methyltransferase YrrM